MDLENIDLIGGKIKDLLYEHAGPVSVQRHVSSLIITHTGYILQYVNAHRGQVLYKGKLCCEDNPREILKHIQEHGYQECLRCLTGGMLGRIKEGELQ